MEFSDDQMIDAIKAKSPDEVQRNPGSFKKTYGVYFMSTP